MNRSCIVPRAGVATFYRGLNCVNINSRFAVAEPSTGRERIDSRRSRHRSSRLFTADRGVTAMTTRGTLRLATRGSDLALRQAAAVREALEDRRYDVGSSRWRRPATRSATNAIHRLGKTGAFVRSLDEQVLDGSVDAAVHSMKDVPTEQPDSLVVGAVPSAPTRGRAGHRRRGDALGTPQGRHGRYVEPAPQSRAAGRAARPGRPAPSGQRRHEGRSCWPLAAGRTRGT